MLGTGRSSKLDAEAAARLIELFEDAEDNDAVRMVALTGTGKAFCSGFAPDVNPLVVESLAVLSKPTVAIINGDATDEGFELAMAADIRVAAASSRFALTQLVRGSLPRFGGTQRLPRLVGASHALRMILTGAAIDASEGHRIGSTTTRSRGTARTGTRATGRAGRSPCTT